MKSILLTTVLLISAVLTTNSQIRIQSDGDIGIGKLSPTSEVDTYCDELRFTFPSQVSSYIKIYPYYGTEPTIEPSANGRG